MTPLFAAVVALALAADPVTAAAQHAHQHGVVRLDIAIEPGGVALQLHAPLDSLLGFERPPRSSAERAAADRLLQRLRAGQGLFAFDAAAGCTLRSAAADAPALAPGAAATEHAELEAHFQFACGRAAALDGIDVGGLLDAFGRIARVDARIVGDAGQFQRSLKRPQRVLRWGR